MFPTATDEMTLEKAFGSMQAAINHVIALSEEPYLGGARYYVYLEPEGGWVQITPQLSRKYSESHNPGDA